jgi:hypothetical protein
LIIIRINLREKEGRGDREKRRGGEKKSELE